MYTYLGTNVANSPCFLAIDLITSRAKTKLSAAVVQRVYLNTISN